MTAFRLLLIAAPLLVLAGCGSDAGLRGTSNCNGILDTVEDTVDDLFDADGDGFFDGLDEGCADTYGADQLDCDDEDEAINPGVLEETCNGVDDDCDTETSDEPDSDGDGFTPCEGDCDDNSADVGPDLAETACDGLDNDCDGSTVDGADADGDGYTVCDDCVDDNPAVNPAATEVDCDGLDNDCNEVTPDGADFDGDSWLECFDCDDADPLRYPGATEICEDDIDQNCDEVDDDCAPPTWDGIWDTEATFYSCALGQVGIDFDSVNIVDTNPNISFSFIGPGAQPGTVTGTLAAGDTFNANRVITGGCEEGYSISGSFTSGTTFTATLNATYTDLTGTGYGCFDCTNQVWTLNGTR
jgi:hypothetical protein